MKKLLFASFFALPTLAFAGGMGNVDLSDYNIVPQNSTSALMDSSEAPSTFVAPTTKVRTSSTSERRRGTGFRPGSASAISSAAASAVSPAEIATYALNGVPYATYQSLADMLSTLDKNSTSYTFNGNTFDSYAVLVDAITTFLRGKGVYFLDGMIYSSYWDWVSAYRSENDRDMGVTRTTTSYRNYGDAYSLSTGLEPIDPKDNTYRGQSREDERQSAAQLKMLRLRGLR